MQPVQPQHCTLVNVDTGQRIQCQFNPSHLQERVGAVQYARLEPIGVPHQVLHYRHTENRRITADFYMDAIGTGFDIAAFRTFLLTLTRPTPGRSPSSPSVLLLIWPGLLTLATRLVELSFAYEQLAADGQPLVCTAHCTLEVDERVSRGGF